MIITGGGKRLQILVQRHRVEPGDAPGGGKPQPAIARFGNRRLGNSFCGEPGKSIQRIEALAGNGVGRVAQPPRQLAGSDMGDAGGSVHPKVAGLCFHHAGDSAGQILVFPTHKVEMALGKQFDPARSTEPDVVTRAPTW